MFMSRYELSLSSLWGPFSPQSVEFEKLMTFSMPAAPLEEHYGEDWYVPKVYTYVQSLTRCKNRCQVLRPGGLKAGRRG